MKIKIIISIILSLTFSKVFSQFFDESQSPLSVKWRQINADGFKIIYPSPIEKDAQRMANTLRSIYPKLGKDLHQQKTTIPILLQNQGTSSNGFAQLAPKKSVFYTIYPQNFDNQDWLNNLAIHELRHVAQYNKLTGKTGYPFPENIYFAYLGLSTPVWFLEGDAVYTETQLSHAGRGMQPEWIMAFRTQVLSGQKLSYSKAYFGSEKDKNIGYYQLGYLLNSQLHHQFDNNIINQIFEDIRSHPFRLYPFSQSLKKLSGYNTKKYFDHTLSQLKKTWEKQAAQTNSIDYPILNKQNTIATDYYNPTILPNEKILALKLSKQITPTFISIDSNKKEEKICTIGQQEEPWYSYAADKIVWDENRPDPRYQQRSYNVLCIYDFASGDKKQITHKTRLFAPRFSTDGTKIIAVKINYDNSSNLVIIDSKTGVQLDSLANPTYDQLQYPAFGNNNQTYTWVAVNEKGKSLWVADNHHRYTLIENSTQQINRPQFYGDKIIFNAHFNGINNIYSIDTNSKEIKALTASKYGAFNANMNEQGEIIFNNYQKEGMSIAKAKIKEQATGENNFVFFGQTRLENDYAFNHIPDSIYTSKTYHSFLHSFNFHSLAPTSVNNFDKIGIQLQSDDLLNTTKFYTGINYLSSLGRFSYETGLSYKALYPIINLSYTNRPRLAYYLSSGEIHEATWREDYWSFKLSQPLNFKSYNHRFGIMSEIGTYFINRHLNSFDAAKIVHQIHYPISYRFSLSHQTDMAERDIAPKWAQIIQINYQNAPFEKHIKGKLFALDSYFYFPGVLLNHSFLSSFHYQQNTGTFKSINEIETVYGYYQIRAKSALRNTLLFNYRFPISYPDLEMSSIAYIRNLKMGLFCHFENIGLETDLTQPKTYGFEISSDMNLLRYLPVATLGGRFIFVDKNYNKKPIFELLFNYFF